MDSGAQRTILAEGTANNAHLPVSRSKGVVIRFGNDTVKYAMKKAKFGRKEAIVPPGKINTYVAVNDLIGGDNKVIFSKDSGMIKNDIVNKQVCMVRDDNDLWRLSIRDACAVTQWPYDQLLNATTVTQARVVVAVSPKAKQRKMLGRLVRLHKIYGHPPIEVMWKAIKYGHWRNTGIDVDIMRRIWANHQCVACIMAKSNKIPKSIASDPRTTVPGEVICGDPIPVDIVGVSKATWMYLFKDVRTQFWHGFLSTVKSEFVECLEKVIKWYVNQGWKPLIFRSDNEIMLRDTKMKDLLERYDMQKQSSAPYQHYQNSVERDVQTLIKRISCVIHDQPLLPAKWWDYVFWHEIDLHNRLPNTSTANETPISMVMKNDNEKWTNVANTYNFQMGELVGVGIAKEHRTWKFDTKRELGVYVGQPAGQVDSHLIYFPYTDSVLARADVIPLSIPQEDLARMYLIRAGMRKPQSVYGRVKEMAQDLGLASDAKQAPMVATQMRRGEEIPPRMATRNRPVKEMQEATVLADNVILDPDCDFRASQENIQKEIKFNLSSTASADFVQNDEDDWNSSDMDKDTGSFYSINAVKVHNDENPTLTQALRDETNKANWEEAIRSEVFDNLLKPKKESLEPVVKHSLPKDVLITYLTFVLKKNVKPGRKDRFKARGCMRGDLLSNRHIVET